MSEEQPNNPLHGITLKAVLETLVELHGWPGLAARVPIGCFKSDPSIKSSLKFLRKTDWARARVERLYLAEERRVTRNRKRKERRATKLAHEEAATSEGAPEAPPRAQARFSTWSSFETTPPEGSPGVVQLKCEGKLLQYPQGRSAMLWYGAGADLAALTRQGAERASDYPAEQLRWRVLKLPLADAEATLADLMARFIARFGAPPAAMEQAPTGL
ncbi:MAG: VF530 family protein [Myxococcota bacterium]